jgi:hypothetical protein
VFGTKFGQKRWQNMSWRLRIYEVLATPADGWLWHCPKVCGFEFECGPNDDPDTQSYFSWDQP